MKSFHATPIFFSGSSSDESDHLLTVDAEGIDVTRLRTGIEQNRLVLVRSTSFEQAGAIFRALVDAYGLTDSYALQMEYVAQMLADRDPVGGVAVTVNRRGPLQIIQPHAEGDSSSQLDLFGLHCTRNADSGGENILSLIDQSADHSRLRAKEKAILGSGLSPKELTELRRGHRDATEVLATDADVCRVLKETSRGKVVVRRVPIQPARSVITGESLVTYWDNVTVHDRAFHRFQYELLRHLELFHDGAGDGYEPYMHVEDDSPWKPADSDSGDVAQTAALFRAHVVHKMAANDFLLFNNRAWTHAVNNWPAGQTRELTAMYA